MARALNTDYYQAFRFAVSLESPGSNFIQAQAGFNNVTIPELSVEATEYRDGITVYTKKQPGLPTVSDSTWQQGVAATGNTAVGQASPFFNWMLAAINGEAYRANVTLWHIHLADGFPLPDNATPGSSRAIVLYEAFPIRVKPDGDFDATSAEVSMREIDVCCEYLGVAAVEPAVGAVATVGP